MVDFKIRRASCYRLDAVCRLMTHGFYDWSGYLPGNTIFRCLINVNFLSFRYGFLDEDKLRDDHGLMIFVVRSNLKLTPQFYKRTKRYSQGDFMVSSKFLSFGKSSLCIRLTVWIEGSGETIGQCDMKMVLVDSKTRRPSQIPKWFVEKYRKYAIDSNTLHTLLRSEAAVIPRHVFQSTVRTRYSDLDDNNHVNTAMFVEFCIECATEASLAGFYRHFNSTMTRYPLLNMDTTFVGECEANQNLTMITWQDEGNVQKIHFAIFLKGKLLIQATATFGKDQLTVGKVQYYDSKL